MNVLYVVYAPFPDGPTAQRALNVAKALRESGVSVTFLVDHFNGSIETTQDDNCVYQGFPSFALKKSNSRLQITRYLAYGTRVISWLRGTKQPWDAVILYNPKAIQHLLLQPYCRHHQIPIVIDCTEWRDGLLYPGLRWMWHRLESDVSARYFNVRARNVIGISSYLTNYYQSRNVRTVRIPPLFDLDDAKWRIIEDDVPSSSDVRIMYGGSPGRKDAIENIIEAFWLLKQTSVPAKLELVGIESSQFEHMNAATKKRIQQLGDTLIIHGRFPTAAQALQKLCEADVLILIKHLGKSIQAQFPSKLVEYMALGKPIIINNTSDIRLYVRNGREGFVVEGVEPETIAEAVQCAVQERDRLPEMGRNSRLMAETAFDYRNYASILYDFVSSAK